jgi:transcriptional regulator with XRE-family HTH domain
MKSDDNDFGRRLRKLREARPLTQWDAARAVGVTPNTWWSWEKGRSRPNPYKITSIASVLGISEAFLTTGAEATESKAATEDPDNLGSFATAIEQARNNLAAAAGYPPERLRLILEFL